MAVNTFSDRQIEASNMLNEAVSDGHIPAEVMDSIMALVAESEQKPILPTEPIENSEASIKMKMMETSDWRQRASLAALLISKSLER